MAISFPALLKLANFSQDKIEQLMGNIDYVSEADKIKLSDTAWSFITTKYYAQIALEEIQILDEVKQGKRKYDPNDLQEVKAKALHELIQKLNVAQDEQAIGDVKKQLEKYKTPKTNS